MLKTNGLCTVMHIPTLTIGIPVYNGMPYIKDCLESIAAQLTRQHFGFIEILVSDNASTDESALVIEKYVQKFPGIFRINTNPQNIGYDGNIFYLVQASRGEYLWFLGCQERLMPNTLNQILSFLKVNRLDYVQLSFEVLTENQQTESKQHSDELTPQIYQTTLSLLNALGGPGMALSTNVIRKRLWHLDCKHLKTKGWAHVEGIFDLIFSEKFQRGAHIPQSLFYLFRESDGWWETQAVYGNFLSYLELLKKTAPETQDLQYWHKKRMRHLCGQPLRHSISLGKQKGFVFTLASTCKLMTVIGFHPILQAKALLLTLFPRIMFATPEKIAQRIKPNFFETYLKQLIRSIKSMFKS